MHCPDITQGQWGMGLPFFTGPRELHHQQLKEKVKKGIKRKGKEKQSPHSQS